MASVKVEILGEPVAKGRPRATSFQGRARTYTPAKTRNYESHVREVAAGRMQELGLAPFRRPVEVEIGAVMPVPRSWSAKKRAQAIAGVVAHVSRPDLDNIAKAVLDAVNGVVIEDDCQIVSMVSVKHYGEAPKVVLFVREVATA